jgi:hypothetical protein
VPTTSLTVFKSGTRLPSDDNVDKLANELGMEVYDRLGRNRKMPKGFDPLAVIYELLSRDGKKRLLDMAKNLRDEEVAGDGGGNKQAV